MGIHISVIADCPAKGGGEFLSARARASHASGAPWLFCLLTLLAVATGQLWWRRRPETYFTAEQEYLALDATRELMSACWNVAAGDEHIDQRSQMAEHALAAALRLVVVPGIDVCLCGLSSRYRSVLCHGRTNSLSATRAPSGASTATPLPACRVMGI